MMDRSLYSENTTPIEAIAVNRFFAERFPNEAHIVAPYVIQLFHAWENGHSYITLTNSEVALLEEAASTLVGEQYTPLILQDNQLFIGHAWQLEADIAQEIHRLNRPSENLPNSVIVSDFLKKQFSDPRSHSQKEAVALALLNLFVIITGGPGTGKTTTVASLLELLQSTSAQSLRIALAAPTGKAAARLTESIQNRNLQSPSVLSEVQGQTIHRLLGISPPHFTPRYHHKRPLNIDVLIVDEASMLDLSLMLQLLQALPTGCRLILLGDENQLPSVEAGSILATLSQPTVITPETATILSSWLGHTTFPTNSSPPLLASNTAHLSHSFRFDSQQGIGLLAKAIIHRDTEQAAQAFSDFPETLSLGMDHISFDDYHHLQADYWKAVASKNIEEVFKHQTKLMTLAVTKEDVFNWNQAYCRYLQNLGIAHTSHAWFAGQPILITQNNYNLDLYNGDIGIVMPSQETDSTLLAYFKNGAEIRSIALNRLPEHETAFAMTVHKSQGSEYDQVWLLSPIDQDALTRPLLYTALTRARQHFHFTGTHQEIINACNREEERRSALLTHLQAQANT